MITQSDTATILRNQHCRLFQFRPSHR